MLIQDVSTAKMYPSRNLTHRQIQLQKQLASLIFVNSSNSQLRGMLYLTNIYFISCMTMLHVKEGLS